MKKVNLKLIILVPTILLLKRVSLFKLLYNILVIAFLRQKIFSMGYERAILQSDDTLVYFLEDDYLHVPHSLDYLKEAAECNYTDYLTLYDHPDKYTNDINPFITGGGELSHVFWCGHRHWKQTNSTTMTFAAFVNVLKKDKKTFFRWTNGCHPWDFLMFTDLIKMKGRSLSCPIPSCSTHGETSFLAKGVEWEKISHI